MTFGEFAPVFFAKRKVLVLTHQLCAASYRSDEIRFAKIHLEFGATPLRAITPCRIDAYLDSLILKERSPGTRNRYRALLHIFFKYALQQGHIDKNPVADIVILSEKLKSRPVDYWHSLEDVERYIRAAHEHSPVFGIGAAILCFGGCRIGEALALQWRDVDWDKRCLRIHRTVERHSNSVVDRTKGQKAGGGYTMLMVERLHQALLRWQEHRSKEVPSDFILHQQSGRHFDYDRYYKAHQKIVKLAGVKPIRLHDLRRTFATAAERAGFHRAEIGRLLGHECLKSTEAYVPKHDLEHLIEKARRTNFLG